MRLAGVIAVAGAACSPFPSGGAFPCQSDAQCVSHGAQGVCQPSGFCSFPDGECAGGQRYGNLAGGGLANQCVIGDGGVGSGVDSGGDDAPSADASTTTVKLLQHASNTASSGTTVSVTLPGATVTHDLIVVVIGDDYDTVQSITDNASPPNTYQSARANNCCGGRVELWYAKNITGTSTPVITATFVVGTGAFYGIAASEFSGLSIVAPFDAATNQQGAGTAASSGTIIPSAPGELLVGALTTDGTVTASSVGTGYAFVDISNYDPTSHMSMVETLVDSQTGAIAATFNITGGSPSWGCVIAAFKP